MKKSNFTDGICNDCGNTGLAGEKCLVCGGVMSKIELDEVDKIIEEEDGAKEPEVYPLEEVDKEIIEEEDGI